jgi:EVE domain
MRYFLDLFTPETWSAFQAHGGTVSGFRERQRRTAEQVNPGDLFLCYLVRLSRWCGVLEVASEVYTDSTPIFDDPDPFVMRFKVVPRVLLAPDRSIPIVDDEIWPHLTSTQHMEKGVFGWAQSANMRASLREINAADGDLLVKLLSRQAQTPKLYPLSQSDQRKLTKKHAVRAAERSVIVEVPDEEDASEGVQVEEPSDQPEVRESHRIQGVLAQIGLDSPIRPSDCNQAGQVGFPRRTD